VAIYYVRKTGNDTNDGLTPAAAFLTIDKAANTVQPGDTVHIGAGVYRELVTMDTSGTSGNAIRYIGDVTGAYTGDAGLVVLTGYDAETARGTGPEHLIDLKGALFVEFHNLVIVGGNAGTDDYPIYNSATASDYSTEGVRFQNCFIKAGDDHEHAILINVRAGGTPSTQGLAVDGCVIMGHVQCVQGAAPAADVDMKWLFTNNVFLPAGQTLARGFFFDGPTSGTTGVFGFDFYNNTFIGLYHAIYSTDNFNTTHSLDIYNNLFWGCYMSVFRSTDGGIVNADYNTYVYTKYGANGVTEGEHSTVGTGTLLGFMVNPILEKAWGWSPFSTFEPVSLSSYVSSVIGTASATYAPATDMLGNPRPMGRNTGGALTADIGAVEARTRPVDETTTVHGGGHAARFSGAGFYECFVPVSAAETTISVYAYKDANYTGDAPIMEIYNIPGVADQSDAMAGAAESWEQLACTFTPTAAGLVRVRLRSRDTSATGECFFDDLEVS
jgi:hypothetical protein